MKALNHLDLLGKKGIDRVTDIEGVVTSVSFDLYGCIQLLITAKAIPGKGYYPESVWLDLNRVAISGSRKVMETPDYDHISPADGNRGPADKPIK